ncbi:MAG: TIGR02444 family protein [Spongiibacteraceae bacterium]
MDVKITDNYADEVVWRYVTRVYAAPGVQESCLRLQDRHGLDVCLLLMAAYSGGLGQRWSKGFLQELVDASANIRSEYVLRIRILRVEAKSQDGALYDALKAAELAAERCQLRQLSGCLKGLSQQQGSLFSGQNIELYASERACLQNSDLGQLLINVTKAAQLALA